MAGAFCIRGVLTKPARASLAVEIPDFLGAAGVAELADGLVFNLADTLPGDAKNLAHFFQGVGAAVGHAEAHPQHLGFPLGQGSKNLLQGLSQQGVGGGVGRAGGALWGTQGKGKVEDPVR